MIPVRTPDGDLLFADGRWEGPDDLLGLVAAPDPAVVLDRLDAMYGPEFVGVDRALFAALVAHLPGEHDQKTHGRKGGVSPEIAAIRAKIDEAVASAPEVQARQSWALLARFESEMKRLQKWDEWDKALADGEATTRGELADLEARRAAGEDGLDLAINTKRAALDYTAEQRVEAARHRAEMQARLDETVAGLGPKRFVKLPAPEALEEIGRMIRDERNRRVNALPQSAVTEATLDEIRAAPADRKLALLAEAQERIAAERERVGASLLAVLSEIRPFGPAAGERIHVEDDLPGNARYPFDLDDVATGALRHYPSDWIARRWTEGAPVVAVGLMDTPGLLGSYADRVHAEHELAPIPWAANPTGGAMKPVVSTVRGSVRVSPIGLVDGGLDTAGYDRIFTHELGHAFQHRREGIREAERAYLTARGGSATPGFAPKFDWSDIKSPYATRAYQRQDENGQPLDEWEPLEMFPVGMESAFFPGGPNSADVRLGDWALGLLVTL